MNHARLNPCKVNLCKVRARCTVYSFSMCRFIQQRSFEAELRLNLAMFSGCDHYKLQEARPSWLLFGKMKWKEQFLSRL